MPYKVVSYPKDGVYGSLVVRGKEYVEYKVGVPSHPKCGMGPLTALKTKGDVISFVKRYRWEDCPIFRVRIIKYKGKKIGLWDGKHTSINLPQGTIRCSSITLLKRVYICWLLPKLCTETITLGGIAV